MTSKLDQTLKQAYLQTKEQSEKEYFEIHVERYRFLLQQICSSVEPGTRILDIGCYPPHIFNILKSLDYNVFGISSDFKPVQQEQITTVNIEKQLFPYRDNTFNTVIFSEVIEHLIGDPKVYLSEIHRVLKPQGKLFLTTPNTVRSQNLFKILFGKNIYFPLFQLTQNIYFRHNREYTMSELKQLLLLSKFKIKNSKFFISYTPFRPKNNNDRFSLKLVKFLNFLFMRLFPSRQDTIFLLAQKN